MTGQMARFTPLKLCLVCALLVYAAVYPAYAGIRLPQANGKTLILPAPARHIVTLAPNLAELVYAAGAGDYLDAVVEYSNFPPPVTNIPRVGDAFRIDMERLITLKPDLVIAWQSGNPQQALQKLQQLGVTVWQIEISTPEQIADTVEHIAMAAGTQAYGRKTARGLRQRLAKLKQQNMARTPLDYFFQIASQPLFTVNGQHLISRSLEICNGHNVFADLPALAPQVSRESVIHADPQVMFAPQIAGQSAALDGWREWPQLQAVHNDALLYLPADEITRASPRFINSIELACRLLDRVRQTTKTAGK